MRVEHQILGYDAFNFFGLNNYKKAVEKITP
jgi:hypothetical protein